MTPPATEQGQLELEGLSVRYVVRRQSQRRRRLALRVSPSGDVEVRVPQHTSQYEIDAMLRRHGQWLRSCIEQAVPAPPAPQYRCGDDFSYLGERWQLRVEPGRGTSIFPEQRLLVIKARDRSPENIRRLFLCWLRDRRSPNAAVGELAVAAAAAAAACQGNAFALGELLKARYLLEYPSDEGAATVH